MNIHTPERQPDESLKQYRERQAASKRAARRVIGQGLGGGTSSREHYR
jgi:hypothetical protein